MTDNGARRSEMVRPSPRRRASVALSAAAMMMAGLGAAVVAAAPPAAATPAPGPVTFFYTGAEQTYPIPVGATSLQVLAVGQAGGGANNAGAGAVVIATIPVPPATPTLFVEVGGLAPGST